MQKKPGLRIILLFILLMVFVMAMSLVSVRIWGQKPEAASETGELIINETMTLQEFAKANQLSNEVLKKVFSLTSKEDLQKSLDEMNIPIQTLKEKVQKARVLENEAASKNWVKILVKFALWAVFLVIVFLLLHKKKITSVVRKILLFSAVAIFGVILGSDPSPMGTVKDAIVQFGKSRVIFPQRIVALLVMLIGGVFLANKFICSWGCQFGTLQDLVFRLNRNPKDRRGMLPQIKVPFILTNSTRIAFFLALTFVAFTWATDIIEPIDPFKLFKPSVLGFAGIIFIALILIASLFTYRPWCHFFCPFGLVGWLIEKVSLSKIQVDYNTCTACYQCTNACPSTVMGAILKRDRKTIPDCFACGTCIETCPTNSISFKTGKRTRPPFDKFKQEEKVEAGRSV